MDSIELLKKFIKEGRTGCPCSICRSLDKEGEKVFGKKEWRRMKNGGK
jgi:hypothetical protein